MTTIQRSQEVVLITKYSKAPVLSSKYQLQILANIYLVIVMAWHCSGHFHILTHKEATVTL